MPGDLGTPIGPLWLQETGRDVTALGGFTTLTFVSVVAIAILLLQGRRTQAAVFTGTVVSAQLTAEVIKALVNRPRPDLVPHFVLVYSASFPSGHAVMAPVVYLTLAAIVSAGEHRPTIKMLLTGSAVLLVVSIGISRVYLGYIGRAMFWLAGF